MLLITREEGELRTGAFEAKAEPVAVTAMFFGSPPSSSGFVIFVFRVIYSEPKMGLPATPPVHVSRMSPTCSARPLTATRGVRVPAEMHVWADAAAPKTVAAIANERIRTQPLEHMKPFIRGTESIRYHSY